MTALSPFQAQMAQRDLAAAKAVEEASAPVVQRIDESDPKVMKRRQLLKFHPELYEQLKSRGKLTAADIAADSEWAAKHWTPEMQARYKTKKEKLTAGTGAESGRAMMAEALASAVSAASAAK